MVHSIESSPLSAIPHAIAALVGTLPKAGTFIAEAGFGLDVMTHCLDGLPADARVLEVGSGPAILLAAITELYPQLSVSGIEPLGAGFASADPFIETLSRAYPLSLERIGYEDFKGQPGFDLIFSINVFEHLPDWRDHLKFLEGMLKVGGRCVILCPNYGFPYESHFGLPILLSKRITASIFRGQIERHEREKNSHGLWSSLNFVTWREVRAALPGLRLSARFDPDFFARMVDRLDQDPQFRQRQRRVASLARAARRLGLLKLLSARPFWHIHPYMHLELTRIR